MKNRIGFYAILFVCSIFATTTIQAAPYAEIKLVSKDNADGTYTYRLRINNQGPVLSNTTTPPWHIVYTMSGSAVDAGGKLLNNDDNIVLFGVDTELDDISITRVTNGRSAFQGGEELGWRDSDSDGIQNKVVVWHLPFGPWPAGAALTHGEKIVVTFRVNAKLTSANVWVAGSDDDIVWVDGHDMGEDQFGIFDGTDGEYLVTFLERPIHIRHRSTIAVRNEDDD